jgi:DAK2 domain fusion protein YloV
VHVLTALDAHAVRHWATEVVRALHAHREEIDDLNVYPVPDGDTGSNLALTAQAAAHALGASPAADPKACLATLARGAVLGARGNSGVILSQILRGLADACPEPPALGRPAAMDGAALAAGLVRAADLAYAAVPDPAEGTILTVARAAATAAGAARGAPADPGPGPVGESGTGPAGSRLADVALAAAGAAAAALARTPSQLPALARAGAVDAGGRGLVVVLDALAAVVTGRPMASPPPRRVARPPSVLEVTRETGSPTFGFEVQYLLHAEEVPAKQLRTDLGDLGDSVLVVGSGDGVWNVHAHTNDVGAVIEAGVEAGRPFRITVTRFADQPTAPAGRHGVALVAIAPEAGLAELFRAEGVVVVTGRPSTGHLLAAIDGSGAAQVVMLPNHRDHTAVAVTAAEEARAGGVQVAVIPTRSLVQGLAAVAVHDASRRFDDDLVAITETVAVTRSAEVTVAARDAITMAGRCRAGDVLGLVEDDVLLIGRSVLEVSMDLVDRLLATGGELLTVVLGADAPDRLPELLERHLVATHPEVELVVYRGGQPGYPVLIGVE